MNDFSSNQPIFSRNLSINCNGRLIALDTPRVMGIINVTPDSFYEGSRYIDPGEIIEAVGRMVKEGADMVDVGASSSRPGASSVSEEEEMGRLHMALGAIRRDFPDLIVSVDTFRASIANMAVKEYRADIINDISGGEMDPNMFRTISKLNVPYILMHMKGTPETMQHEAEYENLVDEILQYFGRKVNRLKKEGLNDIIIDPGFGFGKTMDHNYTLLNHLDTFRMLELPILVGLSRKSMIYKKLEISPEESLNGSTAAQMAALLKGANILRVHDVRSAVETVRIFTGITGI